MCEMGHFIINRGCVISLMIGNIDLSCTDGTNSIRESILRLIELLCYENQVETLQSEYELFDWLAGYLLR